MGMFDYLQFEGHEYQTKDTPEQLLDQYKIEVDQDDSHTYLWHEEYDAKWIKESSELFGGHIEKFNQNWIRCDDFNGAMRFYRTVSDEWIEYNVIFKDGMLVDLKQMKEWVKYPTQ